MDFLQDYEMTIESAPTIPIDNAMLLEIKLVITKVIGGKRIKVKVNGKFLPSFV